MRIYVSRSISNGIIDGDKRSIFGHYGISEPKCRYLLFELGIRSEIVFLVDFRYFLSCPIDSDARIFFFFVLEIYLYNLLVVLVSSFCGNLDISFFSERIKES